MSFLDKKIKDNPGFFDDHKPPEGHRERFLDRLEKDGAVESRSAITFNWLRIAAIALVFVTASYLVFRFSVSDISGAVMRGVTQITFSDEIQNVFAYYDALTTKKVAEIDQVAINSEEAERVKAIARSQLEKIDANLAGIEKEYAKNPNNEMLKAALVNNKRKKAEVIDNILKQLNETNAALEDNNKMKP